MPARLMCVWYNQKYAPIYLRHMFYFFSNFFYFYIKSELNSMGCIGDPAKNVVFSTECLLIQITSARVISPHVVKIA